MTEQAVSSELTQDDRLWACLSWVISPVAIAMLLMEDKKARPFIKYNAVLSLTLMVVNATLGILSLGCLIIAGLIYIIVLAIQTYQGTWVEIPVLTDFIKKQHWV